MILKINVEILCKWISYVFLYFESNSFVLYCLSGYKVRIRKIIVGILCKWNAYVFFYFKWNSHVLYWLSDEKVMISKIILEILLKSNSYVFLLFKVGFLCFLLIWIELLCITLFKWWKGEDFKKLFSKFCWNRILMFSIILIQILLCYIKWWQSDAFKEIIPEILLKSNFYVFYYFKSNSYVSYCLSDEKVVISKTILEI